ncbi:hypothetical protein [Streptomyces fuscichromogenes]|nr:hypothetical protein [Streptomyces fuscichromogenes]
MSRTPPAPWTAMWPPPDWFSMLDAQDGPTVLVGQSFGGAVISEAGNRE